MTSRRVLVAAMAVAMVAGCRARERSGARSTGDAGAARAAMPDETFALPSSRMMQGQVRVLAFHGAGAGVELIALSWDGVIAGTGADARELAKNALVVWDPARRTARRRIDAAARPDDPDPGTMEVGGLTVPRRAEATMIDATVAGDLVVTIDLAGRVVGRDVGSLTARWTETIADPSAVAISRDGRVIAVGDRAGRLHVLDGASGATRREDATGTGAITALALSPDGTLVASAGAGDHAAVVRDVATGAVRARLEHPVGDPDSDRPDFVVALAFAPDGARLATIGFDEVVRVWDVESHQPRMTLAGEQQLDSVAWSPDGAWLAAGGRSDTRCWHAADGHPGPVLAESRRHDAAVGVAAIAFSPDGATVATGEPDGAIDLWDLTTGAPRAGEGHDGAISSIVVAPDGTRAVTVGGNDVVITWDLPRAREIGRLADPGDTRPGYVIVPRADRVVRISGNALSLLALPAGTPVWSPPLPAMDLRGVDVSADGARLVLTFARELRVLDAATGAVLDTIALEVPVRNDGTRDGATGGGFGGGGTLWYLDHGQLVVLDAATHATRSTLPLGLPFVFGVEVSRDGAAALVHRYDPGVEVWDVATGRRRFAREGLTNAIFSPDGATVAAAAADGRITLLDARTGETRATWPGPPGKVTALAFAPGGRVVSGDEDGGVVVWASPTTKP